MESFVFNVLMGIYTLQYYAAMVVSYAPCQPNCRNSLGRWRMTLSKLKQHLSFVTHVLHLYKRNTNKKRIVNYNYKKRAAESTANTATCTWISKQGVDHAILEI